jgi:hypothetical protein
VLISDAPLWDKPNNWLMVLSCSHVPNWNACFFTYISNIPSVNYSSSLEGSIYGQKYDKVAFFHINCTLIMFSLCAEFYIRQVMWVILLIICKNARRFALLLSLFYR